ncbi:MAG: tripartite tricarboxylate transporter substrate binding protein [Betaproteobacteria bacterium]|nr:tripartite tricarboxylate transporter substrate binding protein [Betaproteobacteria bacterium]
MTRFFAAFIAAMGLACCMGQAAQAQTYPAKTIRLIISFPPGGITDLLARALAQGLQANMGQPVIVDNRPGGNFVIAAEAAAKAAPDGYTLFMAIDSTFTLNPLTTAKLPYDAERDFAPISLTALQTLFIVASGKAPANTLKDMLAHARANPGKVTFGSSALITQLVGERIRIASGTEMLHVPFKGSPPMLQALLTGDIAFAVTTFSPYASYTRDGRLVGLAVTGARRETLVPETPTLAELGLGEYGYHAWYGLFTPAETPKTVQARLHAEVVKALNEPATRDKLVAAGIEPATSTPAELSARIRDDRTRWAAVLKATGAALN